MSRPIAEGFYYVHKSRPFFGELVDFMTRGSCVVMVLEGEGAIAKWREIMGATDPAKAAAGTVRKLYGANVGENATHGSDGPETAKFEIGWFFPGYDV
jgi:nucleoside-diphosphate kinase